jgi:hypothetical protein
VPRSPLQPPLAIQAVASVDDQVSVVEPPDTRDTGDAFSITDGTAGGGTSGAGAAASTVGGVVVPVLEHAAIIAMIINSRPSARTTRKGVRAAGV